MSEVKHAIVWSQDGCQYCDSDKAMLKAHGYTVKEKRIGHGYTKKDLLDEVPTARSVPQIFVDGTLISNGFAGLRTYLAGGSVA